jgi:hypothetical protein
MLPSGVGLLGHGNHSTVIAVTLALKQMLGQQRAPKRPYRTIKETLRS